MAHGHAMALNPRGLAKKHQVRSPLKHRYTPTFQDKAETFQDKPARKQASKHAKRRRSSWRQKSTHSAEAKPPHFGSNFKTTLSIPPEPPQPMHAQVQVQVERVHIRARTPNKPPGCCKPCTWEPAEAYGNLAQQPPPEHENPKRQARTEVCKRAHTQTGQRQASHRETHTNTNTSKH